MGDEVTAAHLHRRKTDPNTEWSAELCELRHAANEQATLAAQVTANSALAQKQVSIEAKVDHVVMLLEQQVVTYKEHRDHLTHILEGNGEPGLIKCTDRNTEDLCKIKWVIGATVAAIITVVVPSLCYILFVYVPNMQKQFSQLTQASQ